MRAKLFSYVNSSGTQVCQTWVSTQNQVSISLGCVTGITNWNLSLLNLILGWNSNLSNSSFKKSLYNKITSVTCFWSLDFGLELKSIKLNFAKFLLFSVINDNQTTVVSSSQSGRSGLVFKTTSC